MNDITNSIERHISSMVPSSFLMLGTTDDTDTIVGLVGDKKGKIWLIEMSRKTGEINPQTKRMVGNCP